MSKILSELLSKATSKVAKESKTVVEDGKSTVKEVNPSKVSAVKNTTEEKEILGEEPQQPEVKVENPENKFRKLYGFFLIPEEYRSVLQKFLHLFQITNIILAVICLFKLYFSNFEKFSLIYLLRINHYTEHVFLFNAGGAVILMIPSLYGYFATYQLKSNEKRILTIFNYQLLRYEYCLKLYLWCIIPNMIVFLSLTKWNYKELVREDIERTLFSKYLNSTVGDEVEYITMVDELQIRFACCGTTGFRYFHEFHDKAIGTNKNVKDGVEEKGNLVPASCCNIYSHYSCFVFIPDSLYSNSTEMESDIVKNNLNSVGCADRYSFFYGDNAHTSICFLTIIAAIMTVQFFLLRLYRLSIHTAMIMGHTHMVGCGWLLGPTLKRLPVNHLVQRATQTAFTIKVPIADAVRVNPLLVSRTLRGLKLVVNSQMIYCIAGDKYVVWALNKPKPEIIKNDNFVKQSMIESTIHDDLEAQSLAAVSEFA